MAKAHVYQDVMDRWRWNISDATDNIVADSADSFLTRDEAKASLDAMIALDVATTDITLDPIPADTKGPAITFTNPHAGEKVGGVINVQLSAEDPAGVSDAVLFVDNRLSDVDLIMPFSFKLDTRTYADGDHTLSVRATDKLGNQSEAALTVSVSNPAPAKA